MSQVVLHNRLSDQPTKKEIVNCLSEIKRSGQRIISLVCDKKLAMLILKVSYNLDMTGSGWAWILWNDIMDDIMTEDDILTTAVHQSMEIGLSNIPGLLAIRTSYSKGDLYDDFISEYLNGNISHNKKMPTIKGLKFVDTILAITYGLISKNNASKAKGSLMEHILSANINSPGVAENIHFDQQRRVSSNSVKFDILNSKGDGKWLKIGEWTEHFPEYDMWNKSSALHIYKEKLTLPGGETTIPAFLPQIQFQMFEIVTMNSPPFVIVTHNESSHVEYSGFCIELLDELSKALGFQYSIRHLGSSAKFGSRNHISGHWDGLIGELVSSKSDLAVAPLTVTEERAAVVDFTNVFMETKLKFAINRHAIMHGGDSIIYGRFSFLHPFSEGLWIALVLSVVSMGLYLTVVSRISPYGAHGQYFQSEQGAETSIKMARRRSSAFLHSTEGCARRPSFGFLADNWKNDVFKQHDGRNKIQIAGNKQKQAESDSEEEEEENKRKNARRFMSVNNSLYFACAGLLWQSPECVPRSLSARIAAGIWYMVGVIIVASYTANMVAFVTQTCTSSHLHTVEDLLNQRMILPATVASSSVDSLLMTSHLDIAERLHKDILRNPKISLQPDLESALNLTNSGDVALIWEGASLDYYAHEDDCHLTTTPLGFGKASYAFALRRGSAFTETFNHQILKFRQSGYLEKLHEKYFQNTCKGSTNEDHNSEAYDRLKYSSLSGVFLMISVGASISIVMIFIEWIIASFSEIDRADLRKPSNLKYALIIRFRRLKDDLVKNWLPFGNIREHWSKFRSTNLDKTATDFKRTGINSEQWKRFTSSLGSEKLCPGESISDPDI